MLVRYSLHASRVGAGKSPAASELQVIPRTPHDCDGRQDQDLASDGYESEAMAITGSDRFANCFAGSPRRTPNIRLSAARQAYRHASADPPVRRGTSVAACGHYLYKRPTWEQRTRQSATGGGWCRGNQARTAWTRSRIRGFRVDSCGALHAPPARTSQELARNAHNAHGCGRYWFHGGPAWPGELGSPDVAGSPAASRASGGNARWPSPPHERPCPGGRRCALLA